MYSNPWLRGFQARRDRLTTRWPSTGDPTDQGHADLPGTVRDDPDLDIVMLSRAWPSEWESPPDSPMKAEFPPPTTCSRCGWGADIYRNCVWRLASEEGSE